MAFVKTSRWISLAVSALAFVSTFSIADAACPTSIAACTTSSCQQRLTLAGGTLQVYRSHDLTKQNCDVRHAIIVVHGRDLNPADYFSYVTNAAKAQGRTKDTLIISPFFREASSKKNSGDLYWDRSKGSEALYDWAMGGRSVAPSKISSFDVMDALVVSLTSGSFPNLKSIVVTGHSGGAQLAQRYAIGGNPGQSKMTQKFFYVVANPSSYAYLDKRRPVNGSTSVFSPPVGTSCKYYDEWGYGLDDLNDYMKRFSYSTLVARYVGRKVTYLLGDKDTSTSGIDKSCFADLQGKNRLARGTIFASYMANFYPAASHTRSLVAGVDHDASDMFTSKAGRAALFPQP